MKRLLPLLLVLLSGYSTRAESPADSSSRHRSSIDIGAKLITRGEYRHGGMTLDEASLENNDRNNAAFIFARTRLNLDYTFDRFTIRITPQYQNIWGQSGGAGFSLYEGWAQYTGPRGLFFKVGRQELSYDDGRIIGADDWTVLAKSHDLLKLGYEGRVHKVHTIFAFNQNGEKISGGTYYKDGGEPYKSMQTLWYHYSPSSFPVGVSLMFMNIGTQQGDESNYSTKFQQMSGAYLKATPWRLAIEGSYYRQSGKSEWGIDLQSWMASGKVTFTPSSRWSLNVGYDYLSGDTNFIVPGEGDIGLIQQKKIKGFSPLFGTTHKFYGAMDFFYVQTYYSSFTPGLQNLYFGGTWSPSPKLELTASYHHFSTATLLENVGRNLGDEVELTAGWQFHQMGRLNLGYTFMKGQDAMKNLKRTEGSSRLNWIWIMLSVTPHFLNKNW